MSKRRAKQSAIEIYKDLRKDFRDGRYKPIYLVYGDESYLSDQLQKVLIATALNKEDKDFNLDVVHGADVNIQSVLNMCQMIPMMADRRVVVVRGFDQLKNNKLFTRVATHPNPATIVLLICEARPRFNMNPYLALKKNKKAIQIVEFNALWRNQAEQFVCEYAKSRGYDLEGRVQNLLVEFQGTRMAPLVQEIEKLIVYVSGRESNRITRQDVLQASGQTREINVFELQDAIIQRRALDAHRITQQLLLGASSRQGEALRIVSVLSNYFMKLLNLHDSLRDNLRPADLAKQIGVAPNMLRRYHEAARNWPPPAVKRALQLLLSADSEIKGYSKRNPRTIMTLFVTRLLAESLRQPVR